MRQASTIILVFGLSAWCAEAAGGAVIEKPAGVLPEHKLGETESRSVQIESSKSKLLPLRRQFHEASGASVGGHPPKNRSLGKLAASSSRLTSSVKSEKKISAEVTASDEGWDSAAKKFDQYDPAASVTNGIRVEDIIEPSSEYQYSSSRKKNPFLPEIKTARRAAAQRELSPNDVEIPIINPLQSFPVSQLGVIGVWEGDDHVWKALIETPTNQGIETKLGDPAGNSGGRIMSITPESVVVREFSVRTDGTREYRDMPLYMGSDNPQRSNVSIGGRLILRPGASAPEIESAEDSAKIITTPPPSVASKSPGTLSTVERQNDASVEQSAKIMNNQSESNASSVAPDGVEQPVTNPSSSLPGGAL